MSVIGSSVVLDTSAVIEHFRGNKEVDQKLFSYRNLLLPSVALGELYYGAYHSTRPEKKLQRLNNLLPVVQIVDIRAETSNHYGQVKAQLRQSGNLIPENDMWIAAVALEGHIPVITGDAHFQRISGLEIISF